MDPPLMGDASTLRRRAPVAGTLWGDGFAHDTLCDLWAVRDWDLCSPDEFIFLFPRIIPQAGEFPPALRAHLECCVAVRAWRLVKLDPRGATYLLRSHKPDPDEGARHHGDWFADDDAVTCLLRGVGLLRTPPERLEAERAMLVFLDTVLYDIQGGRLPARNEASEALLAFGAGIHPAYLWPEAAVPHARGTVAGWLGHLNRGRTALMPTVVAEYVLDALDCGGATIDRQLVGLAGGSAGLGLLLRAARRRSAGHDPSIRLARDATSLAAFFAGRPRRADASRAGA